MSQIPASEQPRRECFLISFSASAEGPRDLFRFGGAPHLLFHAVRTLAPHSPKLPIKYAKKHSENRALFMAEKERFELSNPVKGYTISNRARSTSYATSPNQLADSLNGVRFISITDEEQICKCFFKNFRRCFPPEKGEIRGWGRRNKIQRPFHGTDGRVHPDREQCR